jgi:RNA recognition motif-containing protein
MIANCFNPSLFLSGLPTDILPGKLRRLFEDAHIETAFVQILRRNKGVPMPYASAFIRLADVADTERAIEKLNGVEILGHPIAVRKYLPKANRPARRASFHSAPHPTWGKHVAGETEAGAQ